MSQAFITKVIAPGREGAKVAFEALKSLLEDGQSVALITNESERSVLLESRPLHSTNPTLILLTGGSTNTRKAVEIPVTRLRASAMASESVTGTNLRWLTALTPTSIAGANTIIRSILNGCDPVVWRGLGGVESFTSESFIPALEEALLESQRKGTRVATSLVPTQVHRLMDSSLALDLLSKFDAVLVGGAKLELTLRDALVQKNIRIIETYGATETSGGCVYDGLALPGVNVIIENNTAHIFGKTNALCYRDGTPLNKWNSHDIAEIIDGKIVISGRTDTTIKVAGVNVNLDEVSNALKSHYSFTELAVVAIEDPEYGFRIALFATTDLPDIENRVLGIVGVKKLPITFRNIAELPLMTNGKVDIQRLKTLSLE